jgi:outer membrane receptor for ferrienterochelin and colicin
VLTLRDESVFADEPLQGRPGAIHIAWGPVLTHIPNYSYLDLAAHWGVTGHVQLRAGVNNLFDKDPPFLPAGDIGARTLNTFSTYDIVGREVYVALRATF